VAFLDCRRLRLDATSRLLESCSLALCLGERGTPGDLKLTVWVEDTRLWSVSFFDTISWMEYRSSVSVE
jgi:hypothetical protein